MILERSPSSGGRPYLSAGGIVDRPWDPAQGWIVGGWRHGAMVHVHHSIETTFADHDDRRGGRPPPLLRRDGDHSLRADSQTVCIAEAGGKDVELRAVAADPQQAAILAAFATTVAAEVIKIALGIGLETHGKLVNVVGDLAVVIEVFVEVGLAIIVCVVEHRNLVASDDIQSIVDDLDAQRLKQSGRKPLPLEPLETGVNPTDSPDIAVHGGNDRVAIGKKIETADEHQCGVRIIEWHRQRIDDIGVLFGATFAARDDFGGPLRWSGLDIGLQVLGSASRLNGGLELIPSLLQPGPENQLQSS